MAKYMISGSYTVEGKKGLIKDGGIKRKQIVENLINEQGGKVAVSYTHLRAHETDS